MASSPSPGKDLLWFLGIFALIGVFWFATGGPNRPEATGGLLISPPAPLGSGATYGRNTSGNNIYSNSNNSRINYSGPNSEIVKKLKSGEVLSPWAGQVRLSTGNARYEAQANREYVTLEANYNNGAPVTVTGWRLTNGKGQRYYTSGERGVSDNIIIPTAVRLFVGGGANNTPEPITLVPGGKVVIVTGAVPTVAPYAINSNFLVNKCSGYLDNLPNYTFTPGLYSNNCPRPSEEVDADILADDCYNFVRSLPSCHAPKFEERVGGVFLVDGRTDRLTAQCRAYVQTHFNYNACVAAHVGDGDFWGKEWRVYLRRPWQLWDTEREVITLYDAQSRVVDRVSY